MQEVQPQANRTIHRLIPLSDAAESGVSSSLKGRGIMQAISYVYR